MPDVPPPARAARVVAAGCAAIAAFQLGLAVGAPLGRAAWGGRHDRLPRDLRVGSGVAAGLWSLAALAVRGRIPWRGGPPSPTLARRTARVLTGVFGLGTAVNLASPSRWERFGWAPFSAAMTGLSAVAARD